MDFARVAETTQGVPHMDAEHGRRLFDHLRSAGAKHVLEIGTAHGVSAAYMSAAVAPNGGMVTTLDHVSARNDPSPSEVLRRTGVANVTLVAVEDSSYNWWLKKQIEAATDESGNCEPKYDFCYLDGAHNWTIDGFAVVLVEKLLRPGGWLLLDDLNWAYGRYAGPYGPGQGPADLRLSSDEQAVPHMQAVFDLIVKQHPSFTELRVEDGSWGWAHKAPGRARRYDVTSTRSLRAVALARLLRLRQRLMGHVEKTT
jgi:predicted O-methyltransferase YrrM